MAYESERTWLKRTDVGPEAEFLHVTHNSTNNKHLNFCRRKIVILKKKLSYKVRESSLLAGGSHK